MSFTTHRVWRSQVFWLFVFLVVTQLVLIGLAGTDLPQDDQWDAEGTNLYPKWRDGTLTWSDMVAPHNEHRIFFTRVIDLVLLELNGQWDPLVQLLVGALIRSAVAVVLMSGMVGARAPAKLKWLTTVAIALLFLPHLAWNNVLWGFQSQIFLSVLFSLLSIRSLIEEGAHWAGTVRGFLLGLAAQLSMSAGAFAPIAVIGVLLFRAWDRRNSREVMKPAMFFSGVLLLVAAWLRATVAGHEVLRPRSTTEFALEFTSIAGWPHQVVPWAAIVATAPLVILVSSRIVRRRRPEPHEEFVMGIAIWSLAAAASIAYFRGRGIFGGVPSRYIDFILLLPLVNAWCAWWFVQRVEMPRRRMANGLFAVWLGFMFVGWAGLSAEALRFVIGPKIETRDRTLQLSIALQQASSKVVFPTDGSIIPPHPDLQVVHRVLVDPRMKGILPPSFQPERPLGPLSRFVRIILRRQMEN